MLDRWRQLLIKQEQICVKKVKKLIWSPVKLKTNYEQNMKLKIGKSLKQPALGPKFTGSYKKSVSTYQDAGLWSMQ